MITANIMLHPAIRELIRETGHENLEEYAVNLIKSKDGKAPKGFKNDPVIATLIGESFSVIFKSNTNNSGNASAHASFNPSIHGVIIANVAPDLSQKIYQDIFFQGEHTGLSLAVKKFYGLDNPEYINLPGINLKLNQKAYKQHFTIWAENNIAAAKAYNATEIVVPGMGLGIYSGPLIKKAEALKTCGDIQFEALQEVAKANPEISFRFYGLSPNSINIGKKNNLEGIAFNAKRAMITGSDGGKVLRVVAGSINIPLGAGSGDNGQIASDTNAAYIRQRLNGYKVIWDNQQTVFYNQDKEIIISSDSLKTALNEYVKALSVFITQDIPVENNPERDYKAIKKMIRQIKHRNFSMGDQYQLQTLIATRKKLLEELNNAKDNTDPNILTQIIEFLKDVWSWIEKKFCAEKWVDSIIKDDQRTLRS